MWVQMRSPRRARRKSFILDPRWRIETDSLYPPIPELWAMLRKQVAPKNARERAQRERARAAEEAWQKWFEDGLAEQARLGPGVAAGVQPPAHARARAGSVGSRSTR